MRDAAIACIREIGVETGGSNIQFAVNPHDGRMVVIEMNPRVSRSSALASKATGFPIAKIAAKLAVGYTLDEIPNDITRQTPASFEPTIDYCVVKIPRFAFEKFPETNDTLGIAMKSVGEVMAIGRTFTEALGKGIRSLEIGRYGLEALAGVPVPTAEQIEAGLTRPNPGRLFLVADGLPAGLQRRADRAALRVRPVVPRAAAADGRARGARRGRRRGDRRDPAARGQAQRLLRPLARRADRARRGRGARAPPGRRRRPLLQAGRHLRRGVRGLHAVLLLHLRARGRGPDDAAREDHDPRRRPQPHRPGHRVRLLLRARLVRAARDGLRDDHGQLQPGDRLDRLRHLGPALLRAADARGRARDRREGEAEGRHRPVRRPDAAQPGRAAGAGRRADHRHLAGQHRPGRGPQALRRAARAAGHPDAGQRHRARRSRRPASSPPGSATRCSCAPPTCSAGARWASSTTTPRSRSSPARPSPPPASTRS